MHDVENKFLDPYYVDEILTAAKKMSAKEQIGGLARIL